MVAFSRPAFELGSVSIALLMLAAGACSTSNDPAPGGDAGAPSAGSGGAGATGGDSGAGGAAASGGSAGRGSSGSAGVAGRGGGGAAGRGNGGGAGGGSAGDASGGTGGQPSAGGTAGSAGAGGSRGGSGGSGGLGGSGGSGGSEHGFTFRSPDGEQLDWLCTFTQGDAPGYVYVRLEKTGTMQVGLSEVPTYMASLAQISVNDEVSMLDRAVYDHGGGHNNDSLTVDYQGKAYRYYHSSFGFGFRKCQPMDCIDVYAPGATTPETVGCGPDRALPEVCVPIEAGGTHAPLEDTFEKCRGDSG